MQYRKLGKTDLDVSVLSFGASSLGSVFRETDESESIRTVHAALDSGINFIDVSPYYGLTKAEAVLGKAIKTVPRDRFYLSSKAGRYGAESFDFSSGKITASVDESLRRLNTDYLDILFLHDIEFVEPQVIYEEAIPALQRLKAEGKIRHTGICGLPLNLFEEFLPKVEIDAIISYCHYSLNDTTLERLLPLLEKHRIGLVNASPLSMGLLSTRGTPEWHPASSEVKAVCKRAADYCAEQGGDIAKLAVQFSTMNSRIPTTLVSTANPSNIENNARWVDESINLELLTEVRGILEPVFDRTWESGIARYNTNLKL
ncbi:aldo/keto reductase [Paenibacillus lupini]|uniref:aldo/keto reductase n=1 Tax=Paenibacillus lupini TaxID=1450204 RepID=UPI0014228402|nr:aldo/keto reductase [Paenibacillus lupini]NIK22173.1 aryl-alcohol dehydrogenase-like predicted oxidoreductase [Paenibacillus lupini]